MRTMFPFGTCTRVLRHQRYSETQSSLRRATFGLALPNACFMREVSAMLNNVVPIEGLGSLARTKARDYETRTVNAALVPELTAEGWIVDKRNKKSVRLRKPKALGKYLEDRVWDLFYRMRFPLLSDRGGAELLVHPKNSKSPATQIDVVALD